MLALAENRRSWTVEYGRFPHEWHMPAARRRSYRRLAFAAQDRHRTAPDAVAVQITHRFIAFKCLYLFFDAFTVRPPRQPHRRRSTPAGQAMNEPR